MDLHFVMMLVGYSVAGYGGYIMGNADLWVFSERIPLGFLLILVGLAAVVGATADLLFDLSGVAG